MLGSKLPRADCLAKRLTDVTVASIGIAPMAALAVVLWFTHKRQGVRKVFCTEERMGCHNRPFNIWKFHITKRDHSIPIIGRHLKRSGINELPQLINILRGEMSLVGPRPLTLSQDQRCRAHLHGWDDRYNVRPGITGHAQLAYPNRLRKGRGLLEHRELTLECDLDYIWEFSWRRDLHIMRATLSEMRSGHDV